jgi:hypothetical protein
MDGLLISVLYQWHNFAEKTREVWYISDHVLNHRERAQGTMQAIWVRIPLPGIHSEDAPFHTWVINKPFAMLKG